MALFFISARDLPSQKTCLGLFHLKLCGSQPLCKAQDGPLIHVREGCSKMGILEMWLWDGQQ